MYETLNVPTNLDYTWLSNTFLETVLRTGEDDSIEVHSFEVEAATAPGDNYASEMSRVRVKFNRGEQEETKSIIVKRGPNKEAIMKVLREELVFERESCALASALPEMHRLLEEVSPRTFQPFSAKHLYSKFDPPVPTIVMEDLKEKGFMMADRLKGFDKKHCILVMKTLARHHAASAVLNEKNPEIMKPFYKPIHGEKARESLKIFFENAMENVAKEVELWPDYSDRFANKLHKVAEQIVDYQIRCSHINENEFNVLNHGDFWLNNMMFVDYQASRFGNPAHDIMYFLYSSPTLDIMKDNQFLIEEYYKTLEETLTLLEYKHLIPSYSDFLKQLNNRGLSAVIMVGVALSFIYADPNDVPDTEKMAKGESKGVSLTKKHKEVIKEMLPIFEEKEMAETGNISSNSDYSWLNNGFLETALRIGEENENIKVKSYEVAQATAAGDNYASEMSRVRVRFIRGQQEEKKAYDYTHLDVRFIRGQQEEKKYIIIKRGPTKEIIFKLVVEGKLFKRESKVFTLALPEMHRLLEEVSPGRFPPFSAKHLYSNCDQSIPAIVLEDLKEQGFRLAERTQGLDEKHCKLVMRTLARYHAASAALHKNNPKIMEPFYESTYNDIIVANMKGIFENGMRNLAKEVEKWPGFKDKFATKLYRAAEQTMDYLVNSSIRDDQEFNALTHGDFWVNNMMFRYDKQEQVEDVRLAERTQGLDEKHCKLVMRTLARYHAASAVLHKKNPKIMEPFYESTYNDIIVANMKGIFENGMRNLAREVEKWPGYKDKFDTKLYRAAETTMNYLVNSSIRDDQEFNALTHGDFWVNNMMFRYDEQEQVEDVRFVDYQLCHFSNPAHDIIYFLYTSPTLDIMKDSQFLIEEYYRTLEETLVLLGHKELVPSFPDFMKQFNRKGLLAVIMSGVGLAFVYADRDNILDTENMMKGQEQQSCLGKQHEEAMKVLLPIFEKKGWL
ncbi:hypothetical protein C0J52_16999 [Blattella germanica]|nr:hypothetical protein C0J52_16999 [Blattella germanica]